MDEIWKPIKGYTGFYEVSNFGKVRRIYKNGKTKILKPRINHRGYERVCLSRNYKRKEFCVHRLVGNAFIANELNKPQINHINGIKTDNNMNNLEWVTPQENCIHRSMLYSY